MLLNKTKQKLAMGQTVYGVISTSADPEIAEMIGVLGFDYYVLDGEHAGITAAHAANVARACELTGITPFIRTGDQRPKSLLQFLDCGMQGVIVPDVMTVSQAKELVVAVKYPPEGKRGLSTMRVAEYMQGSQSQSEYIKFANQHTMVIPQFEDPDLLDVIGEIAAVDGVDGILFGPRDLALTMGFPEGPSHREVQQIIDSAILNIQMTNKFCGTTAKDAQDAMNQTERGAKMILTSVIGLLASGSQAFLPDNNRSS